MVYHPLYKDMSSNDGVAPVGMKSSKFQYSVLHSGRNHNPISKIKSPNGGHCRFGDLLATQKKPFRDVEKRKASIDAKRELLLRIFHRKMALTLPKLFFSVGTGPPAYGSNKTVAWMDRSSFES